MFYKQENWLLDCMLWYYNILNRNLPFFHAEPHNVTWLRLSIQLAVWSRFSSCGNVGVSLIDFMPSSLIALIPGLASPKRMFGNSVDPI